MSDHPEIIKEFLELIQLDAVSFNERKVADAVKGKLYEIGCEEIIEDNAGSLIDGNSGNIYAVFPGELPGFLLFSAHLDRIPGGFVIKPQFSDSLITTDGSTILAADDIAGVVAILDGLRRIKKKGTAHCTVEIVFTVAEEVFLSGSKFFDFSMIRSKIGYVLDSSGPIGRIVSSAPSDAQLSIKVHGKTAHAGAEPERGKNAIIIASRILADLLDGRIDHETTANISSFHAGGEATNIVCDYAEIKGEARSRDHEKLKNHINYFYRHCREVADNLGARIEVEHFLPYHCFAVDNESLCVQLAEGTLQKMGIQPVIQPGGGGMDANRFNEHGIECIGLATGYNRNHTTREYINTNDLILSGVLVEELIKNYSSSLNEST